jgi:hypothetical protein
VNLPLRQVASVLKVLSLKLFCDNSTTLYLEDRNRDFPLPKASTLEDIMKTHVAYIARYI